MLILIRRFSRILIDDFVENAETLNAGTIQRHDNLCKIADIYHKVHDSHVRLKNEFNLFQEIEKYDKLIANVNAAMYEGWDEFKPKVMDLENFLNKLIRMKVSIYNNIIDYILSFFIHYFRCEFTSALCSGSTIQRLEY